jgi:hypothetical protein
MYRLSDRSPRRGVVPKKRVPPKSRPTASEARIAPRVTRPARTPPSTFLFLPIHLSNSPEIAGPPLPGLPREPPKLEAADRNRRFVTPKVRSFAGAPSRRKRGGAPLWGLYRGGVTVLSTAESAKFPPRRTLWKEGPALPLGRSRFRPPIAAESPLLGRPTDPRCRTRATFLPRSLRRGKASDHCSNQGYRASTLTGPRSRGIVAFARRGGLGGTLEGTVALL